MAASGALGSSSLHRLLDLLEEPIAPVTEEEIAPVRQADVHASNLAALEQLDHAIGLVPEAERAGEHVAEAAGHGYEGNGQPHRSGRGGAERGVASHADQVRELGCAGRGPFQQTVEIGEGLHAGLVAATRERLLEAPRRGPRPPVSGAGCHHDLDGVGHRTL
jgi:hypothetical protein